MGVETVSTLALIRFAGNRFGDMLGFKLVSDCLKALLNFGEFLIKN
jgi:hypothetical protein